jgi:hypothetical protein
MKVLITGFTDGKKIQAIKGIREATGMGLKEAKDIADHVSAGTVTEITIDRDRLVVLHEHGVVYSKSNVRLALIDLIEALEHYPRHLTVEDLLVVLRPTREVTL